MATHDDQWFEFWYTEGGTPHWIPNYILIVTTDEKEREKIIVIDPQKSNEVCFRGKDYDEACAWLWDDDFHLAKGRVYFDDGY